MTLVHQLAAVAADAGRGMYWAFFCACGAEFVAFETAGADLRKHIADANKPSVPSSSEADGG